MINLDFFEIHCERFNIDYRLVYAIAVVESSLNPNAVRFEPGWKYLLDVESYAKRLHITASTEEILQKCSWGLMQVMGSVARELGFELELNQLSNPYFNLEIGCKKLLQLQSKYSEVEDVISAYNQGSPRKDKKSKCYKNQAYVDKVLLQLNPLNLW